MAHSIGRELARRLRIVGPTEARTELTEAQREVLRNDAVRLQFSRQLRRRMFGSAMFGETAWDILLALYTADESAQPLEAADLAEMSISPFSTTLRWLDYLEEAGLAIRFSGDGGRRIIGAELTDEGRRLLDNYFAALRDAGVLASTGEASAGE